MSVLAAPRRAIARPDVRGWMAAASVYFLAVFHRSSLAVAGLQAEHRFGISPAQLSVFVLLQIGVYAVMQVPTGVLVDHFGPRRMLVGAAVLLGIGQLAFAVAPSYPVALLARALLGCGDAMTFISVLRFAAVRFSARRYPVLVALTAMAGTIGNLLATLPLSELLRAAGWTRTYASVAVLSLLSAGVVWFMVADETRVRRNRRSALELRTGILSVGARVATAWAMPGTRLGFWVHFACMSVATSFGVLWGVPYLVKGVGLDTATASTVLLGGVLLAAVCAPLFGSLIGSRPAVRVPIALVTCTVSVVGWTVVVFVLGADPSPAVVVPLFVVTMLGTPVSMAAFALARDYNSASVLGTASGVVNVGGFTATVVVAVAFGAILDALGGTTAGGMRWALLAGIIVQAFGVWRIATWYRRVRAAALRRQRAGEPVPVTVAVPRWWDERQAQESLT